MTSIRWIEQTAADVPAADTWLSGRELQCIGGLHFEKRRADWRLGRWTAKLAVSRSLAVPDLASIEIRPARSGAPQVFVGGERSAVSISISKEKTVTTTKGGSWRVPKKAKKRGWLEMGALGYNITWYKKIWNPGKCKYVKSPRKKSCAAMLAPSTSSRSSDLRPGSPT